MGYKQINIKPEKNKEFKLTEKAVLILKHCIKQSGQNVYEPYDLFPITDQIEKFLKHNDDMEILNLGTTFQVIDSIEYLKQHELI
jgi:hypothetical protein